jgi:IS1 family transposase
MHKTSTTNSWLFPPETKEVQVDEKWSFINKKEANCDPSDLADQRRGDEWDHVAIDSEHRLVISVVSGKRTLENCEALIADVKRRTGHKSNMFFTSDEHAPYTTAIAKQYSTEVKQELKSSPSRPPKPTRRLPSDLCYATVRKKREKGRIIEVVTSLVFGTMALLLACLGSSTVSYTINTSFVERHNGTDRGMNSRKHRKTYGFSKDQDLHRAATFFIAYGYNFWWPVRTLRLKGEDGKWRPRTPAMAAGLADHVWTIEEWLKYPAKRAKQLK